MGTRHLDELFSAAYDGTLAAAERRRYDEHLGACPRCAAAAEDFRRAVDAVRELPQARMPVRVVLPSTPPVPARERRFGGLAALLRVPHLSPAWGAGVMAAAGVAAVVVVVHGHGGGGGSTSSASSSVPVPLAVGGASRKSAGMGNCPLPLLQTSATPGVTAGGGPAGFANRVAVRSPQRPGQELVLATTSNHYAPGSQVLVFAALTTGGSGSGGGTRAVVPCVTLEPQQTVALIRGLGADDTVGSAGGAGTGKGPAASSPPPTGFAYSAAPPAVNGGAQAPAASGVTLHGTALSPQLDTVLTPQQIEAFAPYVLERPLAIAVPTGQTVGGTLPVQVVTIPANLARGTVLRLVALIPAGTPGDADRPAIEAVITLDVS
jgi:anti-sigma factor RsiW